MHHKPDQGEMINAILEDLYDDSLLNSVYAKFQEDRVQEGMNELFLGLQSRRLNSSDQEWKSFVTLCLHHPLKDLLHQDPITWRAFTKPRGYAGDAVLLDFFYGREERWPMPEGTTEWGRKIFDFVVNAPACEGVRARRGKMADLIDQLADEVDHPHLLSIGAGHLREANLSAAVKRK
ncbi:MAG: hypothetical protein JO112_14560 [Planctomycetes bacterium]|nr:hypothetical protein [Planctomycetota bacterium]